MSRKRARAVVQAPPRGSSRQGAATAARTPPFLRLDPRIWLPLVLASGLVIRLALSPFGEFVEDAAVMRYWAQRLALLPLNDFYATPGLADHLPGDLWPLWYVANAFHAFSPGMHVGSDAFLFLLKLVPILADLGIGAVLFLIGRRLGGSGAGLLAAAFYAFNPAPIFLASIWGQWDALSAGVALAAVWLLMRGDVEWSLPVLTYAALIKPTFAALAPLFALHYLHQRLLPRWREARASNRREARRALMRSVGRGLAGVVASVAVLFFVPLPFGVGLPLLPTRWSLWQRVSYSWMAHPFTSLNAFTLWATPLGGNGKPDTQSTFLGLTDRSWGMLFLVCALIAILALYWRRAGDRALVWGSLATVLALYVLPTRMHERYLLPAIVFAALAAAIAPGLRWLFALLSLLYLANLVAVYRLAHDAVTGLPLFSASNPWLIAASLLMVGLLLYVLVRALPVLAPRPGDRPGLWRGEWGAAAVMRRMGLAK